MEKIIDLHTHLNTLNPLAQLRSKLQGHLFQIDDHLRENFQVILSVAMYAMPYNDFRGLKQMILKFHKVIQKYEKNVILIRSQADLDSDFKVGIILHVESARSIKNYQEQLPELFDLGVRGIIPLHFVDNHIGNSCDDPLRRIKLKQTDTGLTKQGREFVDICNQLKIWIDLTHTSDQTAEDLLKYANEVMISHIGLRDLISKKRNKDLIFFKNLVSKNGIIGLTPWSHLVGGEVKDYKNLIDTLIQSGLEDNICIGTDFGAPIKTSHEIKSIFDIANTIPNKKFLNENALRFLSRALPE